ncbi:MAG: hypothetical protein AAGB06_00435 [Verrucomicrobiota bacterium]
MEELPILSPSERAFLNSKREAANRIITDIEVLQVSSSSRDKTSVQLKSIQSEIEVLRRRLAKVRSRVQVSSR